ESQLKAGNVSAEPSAMPTKSHRSARKGAPAVENLGGRQEILQRHIAFQKAPDARFEVFAQEFFPEPEKIFTRKFAEKKTINIFVARIKNGIGR
ncbi:MAG TPA: hypothetical protein VHS96_08225, partial [Bacteroidia bacterium]|nr:hypothetical protein [Bacteroidia bacterium]